MAMWYRLYMPRVKFSSQWIFERWQGHSTWINIESMNKFIHFTHCKREYCETNKCFVRVSQWKITCSLWIHNQYLAIVSHQTVSNCFHHMSLIPALLSVYHKWTISPNAQIFALNLKWNVIVWWISIKMNCFLCFFCLNSLFVFASYRHITV